MYETKDKSKIYLLIFAAFASLIGWAYFVYFKPVIIEASCSDVAAASTNLRGKSDTLYPELTFENVKLRCMEDALSAK